MDKGRSVSAPLPCRSDPERWAEAKKPDPEAQQMCWICPNRAGCLNAAATPGRRVTGIWGGIFLPDYEREQRQWANQMNQVRHAQAVINNQEVA